jgi:hypothetical protein
MPHRSLRRRVLTPTLALVAALAGVATAQQTHVRASAYAPGLQPARAPRFVQPLPDSTSRLYATGEVIPITQETRWRFMCGSDTTGMTDADLQAIADNHAAQVAAAEANGTMIVVDRQAEAKRNGSFQSRGVGLDVVFNITGGPVGSAASFAAAEAYMEGFWDDPITITFTVTWANLGGGVIGGTGSNYVTNVTYANSRAGLTAGVDGNDTIQGSLPLGGTIPVRFDATSATISNVSTIDWTRANYRSTVGAVGGVDASMQYNSSFAFDFDPSNGVGGGLLSLVDTIIHEVGHGQGFVSYADNAGAADINPLDMYRFARSARAGISNTNPSTTAQFQTYAREVDFNPAGISDGDAVTDIVTAEYRMSDGSPWQASHFFEQASSIGIMDPAQSSGQTFYPNYYRTSDIAAFDAIGWDDVPLGVCDAPVITTQPVAQNGCTGTNVSFSVVATGTPTLNYQWRRNSVNIGGATSSTLNLTGITSANAGNYDCVITNLCGTITSNQAALSISNGPIIVGQPSSTTVCEGTNTSFSVFATGPNLTYQWRKNGVNIGGANGSTLFINNAQPADAATYDCVVTNQCGAPDSNDATLTVNALPSFTTQPTGGALNAGDPLALTVAATGFGSITYQWKLDGVDIGGATSATYNVASVTSADAGTYTCVATNSCGSRTSDAAVVTVAGCDTIDFNGDGIFPDNQDIIDFIEVFAGAPCPTAPSFTCNDIDFNNDAIFPDNQDIVDFLNVFAGAACPN